MHHDQQQVEQHIPYLVSAHDDELDGLSGSGAADMHQSGEVAPEVENALTDCTPDWARKEFPRLELDGGWSSPPPASQPASEDENVETPRLIYRAGPIDILGTYRAKRGQIVRPSHATTLPFVASALPASPAHARVWNEANVGVLFFCPCISTDPTSAPAE
jgi:hypothetical protein